MGEILRKCLKNTEKCDKMQIARKKCRGIVKMVNMKEECSVMFLWILILMACAVALGDDDRSMEMQFYQAEYTHCYPEEN